MVYGCSFVIAPMIYHLLFHKIHATTCYTTMTQMEYPAMVSSSLEGVEAWHFDQIVIIMIEWLDPFQWYIQTIVWYSMVLFITGSSVSIKTQKGILYSEFINYVDGFDVLCFVEVIQWNLSITTTYWDTSLPSGAHLGGQGPPRWAPGGRNCYQE